MPTELWFYQLEYMSTQQLVAQLLERIYERNWHAYVRSTRSAILNELDSYLWTFHQNSFLPHALETEDIAKSTPIVLGQSPNPPNEPRVELLLDGSESTKQGSLQRSVIIFEKANEVLTQTIRNQWTAAKEGGQNPVFWRQNQDGRWLEVE